GNGILVVNGAYKAPVKTYYVDATSLALKLLGKAIVNTAMIGAVVKATGVVGLETALAALNKYFSGKIYELNAQLVKVAFDQTKEL
ncbi:MAG: 2-oxoacid:acceptor oxidoreductase family protein, partial [Thermoproteus sp.]